MATVRHDFQDSVFRRLFGSPERKGLALELFNALAGTAYDDPEEIEITTIEDFIYLGRKNDVSFLIRDEMVLWEHQSTYNPNMPLRGLLYFARLYEKHINRHHLDLYSERLIELPTPHYVVFYFGKRKRPDRERMSLGDAFASGPGDLEVRATVLNCNEGHNPAIMEASATLRGYAHLVKLYRFWEGEGRLDSREAARKAVDQCIEDGCLVDYLTAHRAEVESMLFTMADEERALNLHIETLAREAARKAAREAARKAAREARDEGFAVGRDEGFAAGRDQMMRTNVQSVMSSMGCTLERAMDILQIPQEDRAKLSEGM